LNRPVLGSLLDCKLASNNMLEYLTLNNISVSIIVIFFICFIYQVIKVWKLYHIFVKANKSDDSLRELSNTKMAQIMLGYEKCLNIEINSTKKTNIPSSEFFSEHNVLNIGRVNLRMLDAASGILVGLGLLGTFLGLTLGIDGIDVSNTENIQNSILKIFVFLLHYYKMKEKKLVKQVILN
jgi:ABC-type siderophore export system fused ATPase/permease subunit